MGYQQWRNASKTQGESRLLPPSPFGEGTGERLVMVRAFGCVIMSSFSSSSIIIPIFLSTFAG